jgi:DNA polymerase-3 subunit epsilon
MIELFRRKMYELSEETSDIHVADGSYVVMDTELTGLNYKKDSIVSIGGIKMAGSRIELGETFYRVVKPQTAFTSESIVVHGITPSDVEQKPSIDSVLMEFVDFCKGCIIVGHFLFLDLMFINREMKRLTDQPFANPAVDTFKIHEWIRNINGNFSIHYNGVAEDKDLFSMAKKYQIQIVETHNALMDAFIAAQLFQRFLRYLPELGVKTIKDLLRIGRP